MKRIILFVFAIVAILQKTFAYSFSAVAPTGQTLYFNITGGGNVAVTCPASSFSYYWGSYSKPIGNLTIPSSVSSGGSTYSVTSIGYHAFHGCSGLTSVTIPNSVTYIGDGAFHACSGLTSVSIPDSVTSIRVGTFSGCSGLTSVTIPNSVTSIGDNAFYGCSGLSSVTIGDSITSIGDSAFYGCSGLSSVTIPQIVTAIGRNSFSGCSGLTTVNYNADSCVFVDYSSLYLPFYGDTNISIINFGNCVTIIPSKLCDGLRGLTSVTIPNSIITIGQYAFCDCSGLTTVTIGNSVKSIGRNAFHGCSGLTSVTIPSSVIIIGEYAFCGCSGMTSVTIGHSVKNIRINAFNGCSGLTTVNFNADSCYSAGSYYYGGPFGGDTNISTINFGNNVAIIPSYLCMGLSGLTSVTIPNSVITIGEYAFYGCSGLTSVTTGNSVDSIGNRAFFGCSGLTSFTIPNSVTSIGNYAFSGCSELTSFTIPDLVTSIWEGTFYGCSGLTSVTIGNSVNSIGNWAFSGCNGLDTVWLLPNVPPSVEYATFPAGVVCFFVSCNAYNTYYSSSGWYDYRYRLQIYDLPNVAVNVSVNNPTFGTAAIVQQSNHIVSCDSLCIIRATSNYGYYFDHWSNGRTTNPDTLHIVGDSMIVAYFAPNQYTLTLQSADETLGIVNGGGVYNYHDTVTISATAIASHYHFESWSDNNTDNPRQVVVSGDIALTADFSINVYDVVLEVDSLFHGTVSGDGSYTYGTAATVTATPYSGWEFSHWSDGATYNPYTFAVLQDTVLTAFFVVEGSQNGIDGVDTIAAKIYVNNGQIVVEGAEGNPVYLYDVVGRLLATKRETAQEVLLDVPASGAYLVKIGDAPARRVVVRR